MSISFKIAAIAVIFLTVATQTQQTTFSLIGDTFKVTILNNGTHSRFNISVFFDPNDDEGISANDPSLVWVGVGFNENPMMVS